MASSRTSDVNLIVRARTEGERAIASLADTLDQLLGGARDGNNDVAALARTLLALDKAAGTVGASVDKAGAALDRQTSNIAENKAALAALVVQQGEARRLLDGFGAQADKTFVGPRTEAFTANYQGVRAEADRLDGAIRKLTTTIGNQEAQLQGSQSSLLQLAATSTTIAQAQQVAEGRIESTTRAMEQQARAAKVLADVERSTGVNRPAAVADGQGATFSALDAREAERVRDAAAATAQMDREAKALRATLTPLAAVQERLNERLARYRALAAAGKLTTRELAQAEAMLAKEAKDAADALERAGGAAHRGSLQNGFLGLRPHELQNLSYQVNDVVTGLASGQRITQVIAQQSGQILQIFPRATQAIVAAFTSPAVLTFAAGLGTVVLAMRQVSKEAERLREFNAATLLNANGGAYDPAALSSRARQLTLLGASAKDAQVTVRALMSDGIAPERFEAFGIAVRDTAELLGISFPEAAEKMSAGLAAGFNAVAALDNELNFLTAAERERIRVLFEQGDAEEARALALDLYSRRAKTAADAQRGPWAEAARSLSGAWKDLLDAIGNTGAIQAASGALEGIAKQLKTNADGIRALLSGDIIGGLGALTFDIPVESAAQAAPALAPLDAARAKVRGLREEIQNLQRAAAMGGNLANPNLMLFARGRLTQAEAELRRLEVQSGQTPRVTTDNDPNSVAAKQRTEALARLSEEDRLQTLRRDGARRALTAAEQTNRIELAGREARRGEEDAAVAAEKARLAMANERLSIDREAASVQRAAQQEADRQRREQERLARQTRFIDPVEGRVSSGFGRRASPGGVGSTFHQGIDYAVPTGTQVRAPADGVVVETGYDSRLGKYVLIDHGNNVQSKFGHLSDNQRVQAGQFVDQGQLIGRSGNTGTATTGPHLHYTVTVNGSPVDPQKGIFQGDGPQRFEIDTGQALRDYQRAVDDRDASEGKLRQEVDQRNAQVAAETDALEAQRGLFGEALLDEERRQIILQARLDLMQRIEDANRRLPAGVAPITVTPEQVEETERLAGALHDAATARERLQAREDDAERELRDMQARRDILRDQEQFLRSIGDNEGAEGALQQIDALDAGIQRAIDSLIEFYQALSPQERVDLGIVSEEQLDNIVGRLRQARQQSQQWGRVMGVSARDIANAFAGSAVNAVTGFIEKVASGKDVFKSLGQSVKEFAAQFVASVAQMILQLLAYSSAVAVLRAFGVPVPTSTPVFHTGGIAGQGTGQHRNVAASMFAGAMRYHTGGIAGLAPDEVPAILRRGEEVLTQGNPRHRNNIGAGGGQAPAGDLVINNLFDTEEAAKKMITSKAGQRAILNLMRANPRAFKQALGS